MDITTILTIIAYIIVGACGLYVLLEIRNPQETPKERIDRLMKKSLGNTKDHLDR